MCLRVHLWLCGCYMHSRVELRVLGFCPCLAGGKLSPEMKKPLPHGGGSLQGRGSWPCSQASTSGPSPPEAGERAAVPRAGTRGQGRREPSPLYQGALEAVWVAAWRDPGRASRQHPPVSLLAARATLSQAV